jgi:hypothetical protein
MATLGGSSPSHYPIATIVWSSLLILEEFRFNISFIIDIRLPNQRLCTLLLYSTRRASFIFLSSLAFMTNASVLPSIVTWPNRYRFSCLKGRLRDVIMACEKFQAALVM